jgi:hypothetical protein
VPAKDAALMAAGQRPITDIALNEAETTPAWTHVVMVSHPTDIAKLIEAAARGE